MTKAFVPNGDNQQFLRAAFGQFATGVTVVATQTTKGPVGITANSFSSVSLDPALMLWSIDKHSDRYDAFAKAAQFSVQMLRDDQQQIANDFADRANAFDSAWTMTEPPKLLSALTVLECQQTATHDAGDHLLIIGRVVHAHLRDGDPLVFAKSRFGHFSNG
ncbi:MAG: flavin reductase family protein [Cognatishimia sp.]|uniref:flavin reductase family protein n=1 Tax=Cognatishimia sp. TaxID=2211648 RepID=UPI003B8AD023